MKIKIFIISAYLLLCCLPMMAQQPSNCPSSPYPITIKQADGTSLTIIGKGNMLNSWTETTDGYTVVDKNGMYEYASKVNGKLVATGVKARNAEERKPEERVFLQKTTKSIKPDAPARSDSPLINQPGSASLTGQSAGYPRSGNIKTLLILIKFPDMTNTYGNAYFNNMMNYPNYRGTGSFRDYFIKSSVYSLTVDTDVVGWYTAANKYEYYGKQYGDRRAVHLVREAVDAAQKAGVDFSKYDNDKDGKADGIIIAHAGPGAEEGNRPLYIWSHRWFLSVENKHVTYDGVLIDDYMINPEIRTETNDIVGIGVFCHEFGHNLGLPDLYDTDVYNGYSQGVGEWCLMGSAGWLGHEHKPGNMSAWVRTTLGWMSPTTITTPGNYSLYFGSMGYRINTPLPNEYFLIENRQKLHLDSELNGSGLAIWHINTDKTSMYPPINSVNADENLKGVDLEEADGFNDMDNNDFNRGDAGDLFPGSYNKTAFNDATYPNSKTYGGVSSGVNIHDISIYDNGTTARYKALFTVGNALSSGGYDFPLSYPYGCNNSDYINHFSLNTLVNNNSGCNGLANNYINHAPSGTKTTQVLAGKTYGISMQSGPNPQGFGVWIDFNDNKSFDDPGEFVYNSGTPTAGGVISSITIPANYMGTGLKRMRVRSVYNYVPTALDADKTLGKPGETEDYTITIGQCIPKYVEACTSGDYIDDFSFNKLVDENSGCNGQQNNYINMHPYYYTTTVTKGQSYPISMQSGPKAQGFGVWIDYNNDYDFDDSGEFVYASSSAGTGIFKGTINIPATVAAGPKQMRVRSRNGAIITSNQACDQFAYGETQDYFITINNPVITSSSQWNKRFGGSGTDNFSVVIKTSDGGYLLGGHSTSAISGDRTQGSQGVQDYWIVKTDASGNKQWDKRFGGSAGDYLNTIIRTSDGGYLLGGNSLSGISGDKSQASQGGQDYWVVKISSTGVKQWDKRFGGSANDDLRTLHQLSTGEYILTGYSQSGISGDKSQASQGLTDYWVIKISSTGTKLWDKRFGGSGDDFLETSVVNSDGSIILAGRSSSGLSGDKTQASQGGRDFWVVKINSAGGKVWDKRFGGTGNEDANSMVATSDGYLIGGVSTSGVSGDKSQSSQGGSDFWVIKINSTGTKLWDKRFGGNLTEDLRSIVRTTDGGFLLGGKSDSGISGDKSQASQGGQDYWSVKISSSGTKQWDKRFGGSAAEELRTVLQTSDGGYLLAGRSDSGISGDRSQASQGSTDYWMVKVSSSGGAGLITSARTEAEQVAEEQQNLEADFHLQADPNPFTEKLTISFTLPQTEQVRLKVYNSQGLEITTLFEGEAEKDKFYEFEWKAADQISGMYIIRLGSESKVETKKVILTK